MRVAIKWPSKKINHFLKFNFWIKVLQEAQVLTKTLQSNSANQHKRKNKEFLKKIEEAEINFLRNQSFNF